MTSNLIAYWRNENERRASEAQHLVELAKLNMEKKKQEREEKWRQLNYELEQTKARNQQWLAESQLRLSQASLNLALSNYALDTRRQAETERSNAAREAQAERDRVTNSYLTQKKMQSEERIKSAQLGMSQKEYDLKKASTILTTALQLTGMTIGYQSAKKAKR